MQSIILKIYPHLSTILGISLIIAFFILFYDFTRPPPDPIQIISGTTNQAFANQTDTSINSNPDLFTITISGAVQKPGSYQLAPGSIIMDAVDMAGGLTDNAMLADSNLNLGNIITNNQNIIIPPNSTESDITTPEQPAFFEENSNTDKININTADESTLMELSGVGEVTAQKIIDYRATNRFDTIEEIMEVKGIGEKSFEKIKNLIII